MEPENSPRIRDRLRMRVGRLAWMPGLLIAGASSLFLARGGWVVPARAAQPPKNSAAIGQAPAAPAPVAAQSAPPPGARVSAPGEFSGLPPGAPAMMSIGRYLINPFMVTHSYESANGFRVLFFQGGSNITLNSQESKDYLKQIPLLPTMVVTPPATEGPPPAPL